MARSAAYGLVAALALAYAVTTGARVHDYASEQALWAQTLAHQPNNPIAMWGLGDALGKRGRRAEALALYERMAEGQRPYRGPFSWGTRGLLAAAQLQARAGDQTLAKATLRRAFAHDPKSAVGTLYRAAELRRAGQLEQALALIDGVLAGPYLHAEAHLLAAHLEHERGDDSRAQAHLAEAARLDDTGAARALVRQLVSLPPKAPEPP